MGGVDKVLGAAHCPGPIQADEWLEWATPPNEQPVSRQLARAWAYSSGSMSDLPCCRHLSVEVAEELILQESLVVAEQKCIYLCLLER